MISEKEIVMEESKIDAFKKYLIDFLKGSAIKAALRKILGSALMGGFKAWLVKFAVTELFEQLVQPIILLSIRKGLLFYDKTKGKIRVKKIKKAKEEGNEQDYDTGIDDV